MCGWICGGGVKDGQMRGHLKFDIISKLYIIKNLLFLKKYLPRLFAGIHFCFPALSSRIYWIFRWYSDETLTNCCMLKSVELFLTKYLRKSCKCTSNSCTDFSSNVVNANIEPIRTNSRNKWNEPYSVDMGRFGCWSSSSAYWGRSNLYNNWQPSITSKYSIRLVVTSVMATPLLAVVVLLLFLCVMYSLTMSCTVFLAGISINFCWRLMASQSSTSHGLRSSGILILTSTFAMNCSSDSAVWSKRPRFFLQKCVIWKGFIF